MTQNRDLLQGHGTHVVTAAEGRERRKRRERRVGLTAELPEEWVEAVREARVPDEFAHLDTDTK
jgi:hypothetical protein